MALAFLMGALSSGAPCRFPQTRFPPPGSMPMTEPQERNCRSQWKVVNRDNIQLQG